MSLLSSRILLKSFFLPKESCKRTIHQGKRKGEEGGGGSALTPDIFFAGGLADKKSQRETVLVYVGLCGSSGCSERVG